MQEQPPPLKTPQHLVTCPRPINTWLRLLSIHQLLRFISRIRAFAPLAFVACTRARRRVADRLTASHLVSSSAVGVKVVFANCLPCLHGSGARSGLSWVQPARHRALRRAQRAAKVRPATQRLRTRSFVSRRARACVQSFACSSSSDRPR